MVQAHAAREDMLMSTRILIVDDHAGFRAIAREMLEAEGFDVVAEAEDGAAALAAVADHAPGAVLLDVQLPDMSGFDVAARIVASSGGARVILTSSRDRAELEPLLTGRGAPAFLSKADLSGATLTELLR
ncbi:MAG: response regulator, partial [Miltoncostaeaceae bacterium]